MDAEVNSFTEQLRALLKKTFPCILIEVDQEFTFRNPAYGKLTILYSNVNDPIKFKKELYNCFTSLCQLLHAKAVELALLCLSYLSRAH